MYARDGAEGTMHFDHENWTSETRLYDADAPRLATIDAVLARLEPGMTREAVTDLLGLPTETPYFRSHDLVYWLGQETGGVSIDSKWLVVDFSERGLERSQVVAD